MVTVLNHTFDFTSQALAKRRGKSLVLSQGGGKALPLLDTQLCGIVVLQYHTIQYHKKTTQAGGARRDKAPPLPTHSGLADQVMTLISTTALIKHPGVRDRWGTIPLK